MISCLEAAWWGIVYMVDSSDGGFGIIESAASAVEIRKEARFAKLSSWPIADIEKAYKLDEEWFWVPDDPRICALEDRDPATVPAEPPQDFLFRETNSSEGTSGSFPPAVMVIMSNSEAPEILGQSIEDVGSRGVLLAFSFSTISRMEDSFFALLVEAVVEERLQGIIIELPSLLRVVPGTSTAVRNSTYPAGVPHLSEKVLRTVRMENSVVRRAAKLGAAGLEAKVFTVLFSSLPARRKDFSVWNLPEVSTFGKRATSTMMKRCRPGHWYRFAGFWPALGAADPLPCLRGRQSISAVPEGVAEGPWTLISLALQDLMLTKESDVRHQVHQEELEGLLQVPGVKATVLGSTGREEGDRGAKRDKTSRICRGERFQKRRPPPLSAWPAQQSRWRMTWRGKWRYKEHTNVQEFRVISMLARRLSLNGAAWGRRVLLFSDSSAALGALSKGRSSRPAMLRVARQIAAISLGLGIRLFGRYVRSEVNFSDGPSRGLGVGVARDTVAAHADRAAHLGQVLAAVVDSSSA